MKILSPGSASSSRLSRRNYVALVLCALLLVVSASTLFSQKRAAIRVSSSAARAVPAKNKSKAASNRQLKASERWINLGVTTSQNGEQSADGMISALPVDVSMETINAAQREASVRSITQPKMRLRKGRQNPDRSNLPEGPGAHALAQWPADPGGPAGATIPATEPLAPQTLGTQFDGATGPTETGAFPPDTMGAVGPTQVFIFLNGRMRTFNKTTGVADAAVNVDPDVFFASVMTPPLAGEVVFTSDPQVRYDRLTSRWFVNIIDVVLNAATGNITRPNRVLLAVTAAGNETITGGTVWTFYQFQGDATLFTDYQSFGVDSSALYIGGNMFTTAGAFNSTKGFVIPKAPLLTASPATVWAFSGLVATPTGAGPFAPRGVDNYATAASTEGYFIGVDNATFNTLMLRRVTNPGSLGPAPTISANISIATPLTTRFPVLVPHLGNTGGTGGRLDSLDDRLYYAHLRNGRLWTSHNVGVNNTGVAGATNNRNAARWYELQNVISPGTPSVLQSGTLFDNNATNDANQRNYWIPSILVTGQGHAALGASIAGTNERINAFTTGRLSGDTLGTLRDGPGGIALPGYTASATAYNPPGDPGGPSRRWGDYSNTSLDPLDDMTMWTIQEYCNGTNTYGARAVKLIAPPPPPTNTSNPAAINPGNPSRNLVITGTAPAGQGFYDPGPDPAAPHTPFTNISASGAGIIVNSITYNTPTQVTINVSTVGSTPGSKTITITNPDGQTTTVQVLIGPTAAPASISGRVTTADGAALAGVTMNLGGAQSAKTITDAGGNYRFASADTDNFYIVTPSLVGYHFSPGNLSFSLLANKTDAVFTATRDAVVTGNAIDSAEFFVRQHYVDFLGREPDDSGFAFWSDQINECGGDAGCLAVRRINVSAAYFESIEFQKVGGLVDKLYRASYGRRPLYAEFMPDSQTVGRGVIVARDDWAGTLETNTQAFLNAWVERADFRAAFDGLSNERYVDTLIANTGVSYRTDERSALLNGLADHSMTRTDVLRRVVENEAFIRAKRNEMFVMMEYFGYLRRDPDAQGYQFWLNKLNQFNGNFVQAEMVKAFISSSEYRGRFGVN